MIMVNNRQSHLVERLAVTLCLITVVCVKLCRGYIDSNIRPYYF